MRELTPGDKIRLIDGFELDGTNVKRGEWLTVERRGYEPYIAEPVYYIEGKRFNGEPLYVWALEVAEIKRTKEDD